MRYSLYVYSISLALILSLSACLGQQEGRSGGASLSQELCSDETCIKSVCPSYDANLNSSSKSICKVLGSCSLPNMPLTSQLFIPSHGDVACGPTSAHMAVDSLIANSAQDSTGWLKSYTIISSPVSTASIEGCPSSDLNCKKVVTVGDKLIGGSWDDNARPVAATEVEDFLQNLELEVIPDAESHTSGVFPDDIKQCDFVSGSKAITDSSPWNNIVLYLNYETSIQSSSSYNGVALINMKLQDPQGGHFITMNGYTVSKAGVMYKFHCPIYGIKWYYLKTVKVGQPFCIMGNTNECQQYATITELPLGFEDGVNDSFSYLVEMLGEEIANNSSLKVVANITGIK